MLTAILAERVFVCLRDHSYYTRENEDVKFNLFMEERTQLSPGAVFRINNKTVISPFKSPMVRFPQHVSYLNITENGKYCIHRFLTEGGAPGLFELRQRSAIVYVLGGVHLSTAWVLHNGIRYDSSRVENIGGLSLAFFDDFPQSVRQLNLYSFTRQQKFVSFASFYKHTQHRTLTLQLSAHAKLYSDTDEISDFSLVAEDFLGFWRHFNVLNTTHLKDLRGIVERDAFSRIYAVSNDLHGIITCLKLMPWRISYTAWDPRIHARGWLDYKHSPYQRAYSGFDNYLGQTTNLKTIHYNELYNCVKISPVDNAFIYALCGRHLVLYRKRAFCGCPHFSGVLIHYNNGADDEISGADENSDFQFVAQNQYDLREAKLAHRHRSLLYLIVNYSASALTVLLYVFLCKVFRSARSIKVATATKEYKKAPE